MATRPRIATLTNSSVDVLNAIRNSASIDYRNYVPLATPDADVIRSIGAVIIDNPQLQNEFLSALINRIGKVIVTSKMYQNPWSVFKKGVLDYGETIEEIFVDLAKPFEYDPNTAENTVFKREIPDVRSAFHVVNYEKYYKQSIQRRDLERAFLSVNTVGDFISKIIDAMYTGANYDEYQVMKYLLAKRLYDGLMHTELIDTTTSDNQYKALAAQIKGVSNDLTFLSGKYNPMGVKTKAEKREQYLIINTKTDALMDVEVLASAFNMDKAEFMGHRILIDGFGNLDWERLEELFPNDTFEQINRNITTTPVMEELNKVPAVLVDADFFQIYDKLNEFGELYNPEGLYWNYWYHTWRIFSVSPFANAVAFVTEQGTITSITLTPSTATIAPGESLQLSANVNWSGNMPMPMDSRAISFSIENEDGEEDEDSGVTVSASGLVTASAEATTGTYTVIAASVANPNVSRTATITVQ
jgi:hypothetical protein